MSAPKLIRPKDVFTDVASAGELRGSVSISVPELVLSESPDNYPVDVLKFFRRLWRANGYARIKSAHDDALLLPPANDNRPPIFLLNSYRGLSDGEVKDRKPYLKEYRRQHHALPDITDEEGRKEQHKKLQRILEHIPDRAGLQGVETYKLYLPARHNSPVGVPVGGNRGLVVSRMFPLGPERTDYDLPAKKTSGQPLYPCLGTPQTYLFCDGERFQPGETADPDYAAEWRSLLFLMPLLLDTADESIT
jgi:hypothetical protein